MTEQAVRDLTDEERSSLRYFHEEKGDVTRWTTWPELQPVLAAHHPELLKALQDLRAAEKILDLVVRDIYEGSTS